MTSVAASGRFPLRIERDGIVLREFELADLDDTLAVVGDPEVTSFLSFDAKSRAAQASLLAAQVERAKAVPRSEYYLAVTTAATGALSGFVRLGLGAHRGGKLGYAVRKDKWGKGIASAAAAAMLSHGFGPLGLHRVTAACGPDNPASQRVLTKLGFSYEGRLHDHVFTNGAWRDSLLYSILADEWTATETETP